MGEQGAAFWLAFGRLPRLGRQERLRIRAAFPDIEAAWRAGPDRWQRLGLLREGKVSTLRAAWESLDPAALWQEVHRRGIGVATWDDPDYPQPLREMQDPPLVLYYLGRWPPLWPAVAIVGSRGADGYGLYHARRLGAEVASLGFPVVSGMALGADAAAHEGCLSQGGWTLAVLGTGVDVPYPASETGLYEKIRCTGTILSEYPPGTGPRRHHFPERNRIVAGLAAAVVLVQAGPRSGALITARLAIDAGRDVYVVPGDIDRPGSWGAVGLWQEGARPVRSGWEIIEALEGMVSGPAEMGPLEKKVYSRLGPEPVTFEELVRATRLSAAEVQAALVFLQAWQLVEVLPGGRFGRRSETGPSPGLVGS